jgi:hypothetical protein
MINVLLGCSADMSSMGKSMNDCWLVGVVIVLIRWATVESGGVVINSNWWTMNNRSMCSKVDWMSMHVILLIYWITVIYLSQKAQVNIRYYCACENSSLSL